jgi:hypothetical protein
MSIMENRPKSRATAQKLAVLTCPACELCDQPTRFVGLESISDSEQADLCTYECSQCGNLQTRIIDRANGGGVSMLH